MSDKKLKRRNDFDALVGGVCGGIADYYDIDDWLVRVLFTIVCVSTVVGIMVYLVLWVTLPTEDK